ncbi:MAG: sulfatase [Deltaproteobacteria bacterium]|jgi:N-acetylglucosamine-6-sulfatase|nr:sulfatase [Deltaproteobacteria bacterium]
MTDLGKNIFDRPVTRRQALKALGGSVLAAALPASASEQLLTGPSRPNIIFILTDDHRWDALSCMGHPFIQTPHLDRIAREGVLFENAFVTTSLCSPSRASFLTGQYAHTHGVVTNHTPWDNRNTTFLELLKAQGYDTAFIGKWHMPGKGLPKLRGVDHFVSFTQEGGQGVYYDCPLIIDGVESERTGKYITEDLTDFALKFVKKRRNNPFCLYLSHKAVHFGFRPPKHLNDLYDNVDLKLPPESDTWNTMTRNHLFVGALFPMNILYREYCETVVSVDEQVGRILEQLEQMNILDDTIIIYAGDNGHFWGEHGLYDKRLAYEESIRIPLLVRYPGMIQDPGRRASQMILNIDLAPTILDLAGLSIPGPMQGQSLKPTLQSAGTPGRTSWLYEHFPVFPIPIPGITAVRTDQYKYVEYQNDVRPKELFDLQADPKEKTNIIHTREGRRLIPQLKQELERLKQETGYRFLTRG